MQPIGESEARLRHVSRDDRAEILGRAAGPKDVVDMAGLEMALKALEERPEDPGKLEKGCLRRRESQVHCV